MGKIKSSLKVLVFIWGLLSLAVVLFVTVTLTVKSLVNREPAEKEQEAAYEKRFDQILLTVQEKSEKNKNAQLISISKSGKSLVNNYRLPVEKYGMEFPVQIRDSILIAARENEYRVILYTASYECSEETSDYIWFFKLNDKLDLVHVVNLAELTKNGASGLSFFGYKHVSLPYFENAEFKHFIIPIEVEVGDTIRISPLLNKSGMDLLKVAYETEAEKRITILNRKQNVKMLEEYKTALIAFKDATTEKIIPY